MSAAAWSRRTEHVISFPLYKQGTDARRFHYLLGIAVLEQGIEMCCHWLNVNGEMMYFTELNASQWLSFV